jgi:anti-anti-sigma regulatory factor
MDSPLNLHDGSAISLTADDHHDDTPEAPEAGGPIVLPSNVTTVLAEDLRARLVFAADQEDAIIIDADECEAIGQAALQLLIAARREAGRLGMPFSIRNLNAGMAARISKLGLNAELGLHPVQNSAQEEVA